MAFKRPIDSDATVEVWSYQSEHMEEPFMTCDPALILDHIKDSLDDWQRSPIGNGEKIHSSVVWPASG